MSRSRARFFVVFLPFLVALAQDAAQPLTFGDASFQAPPGWRHTERQLGGKNTLVLLPAEFGQTGRFMITLLPAQPLSGADFRQTFEKTVLGSLASGERLVQKGEIQAQRTAEGHAMLSQTILAEDASGHRTLRVYCAANPHQRLEMLIAMADSAQTLQRYQGEFDRMLASFRFGTAGAAGQSSAAAAPAGGGAAITRGLWVNAGPAGTFVKDLAIDAANHTIYLASTDLANPQNGGIYASSDGGSSWRKLLRGNCKQVVPTAGNRIYALEWGEQIDYSDDRGATWTKCTRPAFRGNGYSDAAAIQCIAASPTGPNVLYAGANGMGAGLYKSVDGGRNWTRPTRRVTEINRRDGSRTEMKDTEVDEIAVDPQQPGIVIARFGGGFVQSNDGGVTFSDCLRSGVGAGPGQRQPSAVKVVHSGAVQIDPGSPNLIYLRSAAARGETYRSADGGRTWDRLGNVPGQLFILTIAAHPANPQVVYATTSNGIYVSSDAGRSWVALASADAPKSTGNAAIPYYFNGTSFNSVMTVVRQDEPMIVDPQTGHLLHGGMGVRVLVGVKSRGRGASGL